MADPDLAKRLMTLAGLAYGKPGSIPQYLADDPLSHGDWAIVWIAAEVADPVNFAFIVKSRSSGAYAIAIRGTYPNPLSPAYWEDANQDNPLGPMQPWPLGAGSDADDGPMVSNGTAMAFGSLIALADDQGRTFRQAVSAIPAGASVCVTGHSLGGTLAPVIALWMNGLPSKVSATVYAFAGMTPGNQAFADLFTAQTVPPGQVFRYKNTLDSVPYGWNDVLATRDFYQPAPRGGLIVEGAIALLALKLHEYGYTPIGQEVVLQGHLSDNPIDIEFIAFVLENLSQHLPDTYLALLGAPLLPFVIGFGPVVAPRTAPAAARAMSNTTRAIFL